MVAFLLVLAAVLAFAAFFGWLAPKDDATGARMGGPLDERITRRDEELREVNRAVRILREWLGLGEKGDRDRVLESVRAISRELPTDTIDVTPVPVPTDGNSVTGENSGGKI